MKAFTSCLSHLESLVLSLIHLAIGECNRTQDASEDSGFTMDGEWVRLYHYIHLSIYTNHICSMYITTSYNISSTVIPQRLQTSTQAPSLPTSINKISHTTYHTPQTPVWLSISRETGTGRWREAETASGQSTTSSTSG